MKQAKQQSQDLRQTDEFLTAIMKPGYAEKEKPSKPSPLENSASRQLNGRPKMPRVDSFSRFSDPPAPPPQQPLPEKPDAPPRSGSDALSPLKRSDTEKAKPVGTSSPVSRDSSQILNLIEALSSAKREIDTQGARVKELEILLLQERAARETAEEKVKKLETLPAPSSPESQSNGHVEKPLDTELGSQKDHKEMDGAHETNGSILSSETTATYEADKSEPSVEVNASQLQLRLESMMEEMEEMRKQMASFKDRAQTAENESSESRKSLAEMIENIRREREENAAAATSASKSDPKPINGQALTQNGTAETAKTDESAFDPVSSGKDTDAAGSALTTDWRRRKFIEDASPFASMFGVVILGVGLMAYLNGWQKLDK